MKAKKKKRKKKERKNTHIESSDLLSDKFSEACKIS